MRGLVWCITLSPQIFETIIDESKVEKETVTSEAIASMSNNLDSTVRVITIDSCQDLMM